MDILSFEDQSLECNVWLLLIGEDLIVCSVQHSSVLSSVIKSIPYLGLGKTFKVESMRLLVN